MKSTRGSARSAGERLAQPGDLRAAAVAGVGRDLHGQVVGVQAEEPDVAVAEGVHRRAAARPVARQVEPGGVPAVAVGGAAGPVVVVEGLHVVVAGGEHPRRRRGAALDQPEVAWSTPSGRSCRTRVGDVEARCSSPAARARGVGVADVARRAGGTRGGSRRSRSTIDVDGVMRPAGVVGLVVLVGEPGQPARRDRVHALVGERGEAPRRGRGPRRGAERRRRAWSCRRAAGSGSGSSARRQAARERVHEVLVAGADRPVGLRHLRRPGGAPRRASRRAERAVAGRGRRPSAGRRAARSARRPSPSSCIGSSPKARWRPTTATGARGGLRARGERPRAAASPSAATTPDPCFSAVRRLTGWRRRKPRIQSCCSATVMCSARSAGTPTSGAWPRGVRVTDRSVTRPIPACDRAPDEHAVNSPRRRQLPARARPPRDARPPRPVVSRMMER